MNEEQMCKRVKHSSNYGFVEVANWYGLVGTPRVLLIFYDRVGKKIGLRSRLRKGKLSGCGKDLAAFHRSLGRSLYQ